MNLLDRVVSAVLPARAVNEQYVIGPNGMGYAILNQTLVRAGDKQERPDGSFASMATMLLAANPIVFACVLARLSLFKQARFQFRQLRKGRPGDLFGGPELGALETPWTNATTADLLARAEIFASIAGNFYAVRRGPFIKPLRPDWVGIIMGSFSDPGVGAWDADADVLGYAYQPGGQGSGHEMEFYQASEVAHYAPFPDPLSPFRGMSWMTPVIREVMADQAATAHKSNFFEQGATPNMIVKLDIPDPDKFKQKVEQFKQGHEGARNAYKTLFLSPGMDATVVGANLQQLEFSKTQGQGETRIASAAGVPPVIAGFSEGLQGSSLNTGNYAASMRRFADLTIRPNWQDFAGSMEHLVRPPKQSHLWYDDRDIPALREDIKAVAEVQSLQAQSIKTLSDAGWEPDAVIEAVMSNDHSRLTGKHSGLFSVQLQPPGSQQSEPAPVVEPARSLLEIEAGQRGMVLLAEAVTRMATREAPQPQITVTTPPVTVDSPITVMVPNRKTRKTMERDELGLITTITEVEDIDG